MDKNQSLVDVDIKPRSKPAKSSSSTLDALDLQQQEKSVSSSLKPR
ncbi:hypothetical protein [Legionella lansingensis]|nr:hypothetical protein [Legionella lansingensis]